MLFSGITKNALHLQALNCARCYEDYYYHHYWQHALPCPQAPLIDSHAGALSSDVDAFLLPLIKSPATCFPLYANRIII